MAPNLMVHLVLEALKMGGIQGVLVIDNKVACNQMCRVSMSGLVPKLLGKYSRFRYLDS